MVQVVAVAVENLVGVVAEAKVPEGMEVDIVVVVRGLVVMEDTQEVVVKEVGEQGMDKLAPEI